MDTQEWEKVKSLIPHFLNSFSELKEQKLDGIKIACVGNIYDAIKSIDSEFADERIHEHLFGVVYPTRDGQQTIYLDTNQDITNGLVSMCHEVVHCCDYMLLAIDRAQTDYRLLQDDITFRFWTEFHATYLTYRYYYRFHKSCNDKTDPAEFMQEYLKSYNERLSGASKIEKQSFVDFYMRLSGKIYALQDEYDDINVFDFSRFIFFDEHFKDIFYLLEDCKTYADFKYRYDDLSAILASI